MGELDGRVESLERQLDQIDHELRGDVRPGLAERVTRLEEIMQTLSKLVWGTLLAALATLAAEVVHSLVHRIG